MLISIPVACALGAALCNSIIAVCMKAAERRRLPPVTYSVVCQAAAAAICFAGMAGEHVPWASMRFWVLGVAMGALYVRAISSIVAANSLGPPSFPWALGNLALVVPIGLAAMGLREPLLPIDGVIILAFLAMVSLFVRGMRPEQRGAVSRPGRYAIALGEVFVTNGVVMFGYKLKQVWFGSEAAAAFMGVVFGSGALVGWAAMAVAAAARGATRDASGDARAQGGLRIWIPAIAGGLLTGVAGRCVLTAVQLPAAVAYPIVQGSSLLGGVLVTAAVFRERLNGWKIAGLAAGIAVVILAGLRAG